LARSANTISNTDPLDQQAPAIRKSKEPNGLKIKLDDLQKIEPLTENQRLFFESYKRGDYFIALHGVAGTGKTFCAMYKALEEVLDRNNPFRRVTMIRSAVQSRDIGHLPGTADEKMDVYLQPYRQICHALFQRGDAWQRLEEQKHVEFMSTSFIRGTTFENSIIIVDEMQNMNFEELDTIITRVGHMSKIIFCGDYRQTDLRKGDEKGGLQKFLSIAQTMKSHTRIEFTIEDIVRSSLVKDYIIAKTQYEDQISNKS
jgi:phosphate starvation-inducible PhoH-like protein